MCTCGDFQCEYIFKYKTVFLTQETTAARYVSFLDWATFRRSQTPRDSGIALFSSECEFTPLPGPWGSFAKLQCLGPSKKQQGIPISEPCCFSKSLRDFQKVSFQFYQFWGNNPLHLLLQLLSEVHIYSFTHTLYLIRLKPGSI